MMDKYKIMIVDDEDYIINNIKDYFEDYNITAFSNSFMAMENLKENDYDILICDYKMPYLTGLELFLEARKDNRYYYGILLTAFAEKNVLEKALNENLIDKIIEKPLNLKELESCLGQALLECRNRDEEKIQLKVMENRYQELMHELSKLRNNIIGKDGGLKTVFEKINTIAEVPVNILITGETGTGKELIANTIHSLSNDNKAPFVKLNCASIPKNLFESELFGHEKGAFTNAVQDKPGKIELANSGTLFLDEIGELDLDSQAKLLRVLQEKELERIGGNNMIKVDFRLISATNKDLLAMVKNSQFREDLYYRISTFPVFIPPLRKRGEDIKVLFDYFIKKFCNEIKQDIPEISEQAYELLNQYQWPGNVRELENAVRRIVIVLKEESIILPNHLDFLFSEDDENLYSDLISGPDKEPYDYPAALRILVRNIFKKRKNFKDIKTDLINEILKQTNFHIPTAIQKTGLDKHHFYRR